MRYFIADKRDEMMSHILNMFKRISDSVTSGWRFPINFPFPALTRTATSGSVIYTFVFKVRVHSPVPKNKCVV